MESAPIKINDTVYSCTDCNDVFALDAETCKEKWRFRSGNRMSQSKYTHCRGVSYYAAVVALDAATGQVRWSFQTTHHDLWDYDVASQPVLVDVPRADGVVEHGLIQPATMWWPMRCRCARESERESGIDT